MSTIFGYLNLNDNDRVFTATQGQQVIYDAAVKFIQEKQAELDAAYSAFVEGSTEGFKERYELPGGGYMQEIPHAQRPDSIKNTGYWDVAYPIKNWADAISGSRVDLAKMTVLRLENNILTVQNRSINVMRRELLRALLYKEQETFIDPEWGTLYVEPLANGDTVTYPPLPGALTAATRQRYVGSNYTAASISDTNDPYATISAALNADFGGTQGANSVAVFINSAQVAKTKLLTGFVSASNGAVIQSSLADQLTNVPSQLMNGSFVILGYVSGCWVVVWDFMPSGYMLGVHLEAPAPLKKRVDPAADGLGDGGLQLIAEEEEYPFKSTYWQMRFGLGVGNRLNGYAMQLVASTTYTSPTIS
jgi:hypothetical protein